MSLSSFEAAIMDAFIRRADAMRAPSASPLLYHRMDSRSAKTVRRVIVRQPDRLHPGVDNDGADEFKPALLQRLRDFLGKRGLCRDLAAVPDGEPPTISQMKVEKSSPASRMAR